MGWFYPAWIYTSYKSHRSPVKTEGLEKRRKKQPVCSLRLELKEKQNTDGYRVCWILSTAEDELLSCQAAGPTEGQLYNMEKLSWALVLIMSYFAHF